MAAHTLLTGGAGFIGSTLARHLVEAGHRLVVLDKLTYAGKRETQPAVFPTVEGPSDPQAFPTNLEPAVSGPFTAAPTPTLRTGLGSAAHGGKPTHAYWGRPSVRLIRPCSQLLSASSSTEI